MDWKNEHYDRYHHDLVSVRYSHPSYEIKQKPVFITAHGFGASPFEWKEFKDYVETHSNALVSNVYLGHHQNLQLFSTATWQDWMQPIISEYQRLIDLGFETINLCGCSTGATLMLQLFHHNMFRPSIPIKHVVFIDSLIKTKKKLLYLLPYFKYFIKDIPVSSTTEEHHHWLPVRPLFSLLQLLDLINHSHDILKKGVSCASHITFSLFQSKHDPIIERQSALDIYNGLLKKTPLDISITMVQSKKHVFTRLEGREDVTLKDIELQQHIFKKILTTTQQKCPNLSLSL